MALPPPPPIERLRKLFLIALNFSLLSWGSYGESPFSSWWRLMSVSDEASFSEAATMEGGATKVAELLRSNAGLQPTLRLFFIGDTEHDTMPLWSSYGLRLLLRGRIVGVYMASLTRLVLLGAGLLAPTPEEVVAPPPPPPARSSESLGEEDGSESFLLFFSVFIFVMVFSIVLVASSVC